MADPIDWHEMDLPDEVELGELLYKRNPAEEGGEYVDGHAVTPGGKLRWAQAQEAGYDKAYYAAAAAMLAVLAVAQRNTLDHDPTRNGGIVVEQIMGVDGILSKPTIYPEPLLPEGYEWMICELMGHVCHVGRVLEVEKFGSKMARVDVPHLDAEGKLARWQTHWFNGSAVYRLTPTDEATVMRRAFKPPPAIGRYHHLPDDVDVEQDEDDRPF